MKILISSIAIFLVIMTSCSKELDENSIEKVEIEGVVKDVNSVLEEQINVPFKDTILSSDDDHWTVHVTILGKGGLCWMRNVDGTYQTYEDIHAVLKDFAEQDDVAVLDGIYIFSRTYACVGQPRGKEQDKYHISRVQADPVYRDMESELILELSHLANEEGYSVFVNTSERMPCKWLQLIPNLSKSNKTK